jgi:hypothetical protein
MTRNAEEIQAELQGGDRMSRADLECGSCGYRGRMILAGAKKTPALVLSERIIYASIALLFFASYFAENQPLAFTIRMVVPALMFVIFIYIEYRLKNYTYVCPNCKAQKETRGSS